MTAKHKSHTSGRPRSKANWVLIGFLAIAAFFLFTEHRAHILGILPWLLLLACLVLHLFMHGGQQDESDRSGDSHDLVRAGLWPVGAGDDQFIDLHHLRL